jgi:hypothetical protein
MDSEKIRQVRFQKTDGVPRKRSRRLERARRVTMSSFFTGSIEHEHKGNPHDRVFVSLLSSRPAVFHNFGGEEHPAPNLT